MSRRLEKFAFFILIAAVGIGFVTFSRQEEHRFEYRVEELQQKIDAEPHSPEAMQARFMLGLYYEKNGRYKDAYETFDTVRQNYQDVYPDWHYGYLQDEATWKLEELKQAIAAEDKTGDNARPQLFQ